ncbi:hypothetical protein SDC9_204291 [bioreactor metagenome]|uniref:Uncharacterized protein n=1 Tax=bioreactor metagenome TaxID=1076179 RepID=A0A645IZ38_9ZZZZ
MVDKDGEITMPLSVSITVNVQLSYTLIESFATAVMVTVPALSARTCPWLVTAATEGSLLVQLRRLSVASEGAIAAVSWTTSPSCIDRLSAFSSIDSI